MSDEGKKPVPAQDPYPHLPQISIEEAVRINKSENTSAAEDGYKGGSS